MGGAAAHSNLGGAIDVGYLAALKCAPVALRAAALWHDMQAQAASVQLHSDAMPNYFTREHTS